MEARPASPRLLIADPDRPFARSLARRLGAVAGAVITVDTAEQLEAALESASFELLLIEPEIYGSAGLGRLADLRHQYRDIAIVILTSHGSTQAAAQLTRVAGAADYLTKPVRDDFLINRIGHALESRELTRQPAPRLGSTNLLSQDPKMLQLLEVADHVARSRSTVLITGETGTGKSMLARALHARSPRAGRPFVEVSCGSLPESLLESELFGHVRGAFTDAMADKRGRFAAADGGTLFLDEINSASPLMQVKLLRVLQEHSFEPVGSNDTRHVDVRTIVATNADLDALVAAGGFRLDLYYRINVIALRLPPLRERMGDVPLLAEHFLDRFRAEFGRQVIGFSDEALFALQRYNWPGNVRELESAVERAVILSRKAMIDIGDLPDNVTATAGREPNAAVPRSGTLDAALRDPERRVIEAALHRNHWSRIATARELGIERTTLYKKMRRFGLLRRDVA